MKRHGEGEMAAEAKVEAWKRNIGGKEYLVSTDRSLLDVQLIHKFLAEQSYWAKGIPRAVVEKSIDNSLCFGIFRADEQVGFARVISDLATTAYVGDVFVLPQFRGRGISKWLMECMTSHPDLKHLRRWVLLTEDAHSLYAKFGFRPLAHPEMYMERHDPHVYEDPR